MSEEETVDQLIRKLKEIKVQESKILDQLEEARSRETRRARQASIVTADPNPFKKGDQVKILNKIRLPKSKQGRPATSDDRIAVVTDIKGDKVHFIIDNGTKTWRLHKNLQRA